MDEVKNLDVYIHRMEKSLMDKLFFIDKIYDPITSILDFGCANGVLVKAMSQLFPEHDYIGYDISEEMIKKAREYAPECTFYQNWDDMKISPESTLINISSTVHEVYAYGTKESVSEFWDRVFNSGFKYIAIRDMMLSESAYVPSDPADVEKARGLFPEKLAEYESIWGSIEEGFNLIHYLLKYRYTENWEREVNENYLPITVEQMRALIPSHYEIIYQEHYVLPFIHQSIYNDCGIDLKNATHFKLLLKRKEA